MRSGGRQYLICSTEPAAISHAISSAQHLVLGYIGLSGTDLLRREALLRPNSDFVLVEVSTNHGAATWQALHAHYRAGLSLRRPLTHRTDGGDLRTNATGSLI